jgi:hypothetical protein
VATTIINALKDLQMEFPQPEENLDGVSFDQLVGE